MLLVEKIPTTAFNQLLVLLTHDDGGDTHPLGQIDFTNQGNKMYVKINDFSKDNCRRCWCFFHQQPLRQLIEGKSYEFSK